ncbi:MAG: tetraacyldisaccharide 4'-kinase [Deltaproteobacteria bacterium]|nr:tetraacyldisaccharide 4'-kinase [Deltaproteobacteria bacterium]MCL5276657.1 tetraacyldisaccharide 4'-kinase [Deltaproteobacteria bacterium]
MSLVVGLAVQVRRLLYEKRVFRPYRARCRVISVGNLTLGGTGKTPMVMHLCSVLGAKKLAVVSRGYASQGRGVRVVSDGKSVLSGPEACGDEPYLIARSERGVIVAVGEDRAEAIDFVERQYAPEVIILDDGFSHLGVERDMDIVLIDGENGFGNGHLLPAGPLREPVGAIRCADAVGIKGHSAAVEERMERLDLRDKVFHFSYGLDSVKAVDDDTAVGVESIRNRRVVCMAGIAFPDSFFRLIYSHGIRPVKCIARPDHSGYDRDELRRIITEYRPDAVIVTAKDAVKIAGTEHDRGTLWLYAAISLQEQGSALKDVLRRKGFLQ